MNIITCRKPSTGFVIDFERLRNFKVSLYYSRLGLRNFEIVYGKLYSGQKILVRVEDEETDKCALETSETWDFNMYNVELMSEALGEL